MKQWILHSIDSFWFIQEWNKWLYLWVSFWIIYSTDSLKNTHWKWKKWPLLWVRFWIIPSKSFMILTTKRSGIRFQFPLIKHLLNSYVFVAFYYLHSAMQPAVRISEPSMVFCCNPLAILSIIQSLNIDHELKHLIILFSLIFFYSLFLFLCFFFSIYTIF